MCDFLWLGLFQLFISWNHFLFFKWKLRELFSSFDGCMFHSNLCLLTWFNVKTFYNVSLRYLLCHLKFVSKSGSISKHNPFFPFQRPTWITYLNYLLVGSCTCNNNLKLQDTDMVAICDASKVKIDELISFKSSMNSKSQNIEPCLRYYMSERKKKEKKWW